MHFIGVFWHEEGESEIDWVLIDRIVVDSGGELHEGTNGLLDDGDTRVWQRDAVAETGTPEPFPLDQVLEDHLRRKQGVRLRQERCERLQ